MKPFISNEIGKILFNWVNYAPQCVVKLNSLHPILYK